ncbi:MULTISPECIES: SgcJ/EcaC family oxidoreductase [Actinoalloteichus]|uniref:SgcJ/EcaC family oxidoreductase n=1 Tax=Actinoalloteichus TaxID=65496 RepID=UPI001E522DAB|nr:MULTISPECIES: SgcJ/EcaC family oxidoreductase [Actinoalloteichus]
MDTKETDRPTRESEMDAIRRVVAAVQHAVQNELVEEFLSLFRADAVWTTGGGRRLLGRDEIAVFAREVLPGGMAGLTMTLEVVHVLFIRADVAAVKVRQLYVSHDGRQTEAEGEGTPLFVMSTEDGEWRLVACRNTGVLNG